jgi:hypothetical protein
MIWVLDGFRLSRLDDDGNLAATVELENAMEHDSAQLLVGAGAVWVAAGHAILWRVDRDRVTKTLDIGYHLDGLAASEDALFLSNDRRGGRILRVDPADNRIDLAVQGKAHQLAFGGGALWASWESTITRLDPRTLKAESTIDLGGYVSELAHGVGALWAVTLDDETAGTDDERSRLWRIGEGKEQVAELRGRPALAVGDAVWLDDGSLCRFDGGLTRFPVKMRPFVARGGEVWGLDEEGALSRFRPALGRCDRLGYRGQGIAG